MVSAATRTANGMAVADSPAYAQENCAPDGAMRGSNGSVVALKEPLKRASDEPTSPAHSSSSTVSDMPPTTQMTPRRVLQVIDANRMSQTPTASRSVTVSLGSELQQQPFKPTGITGSAHGKTPLSGLKRKHRSAAEHTPSHQRSTKQQQQLLLSPRLGSAFDDDYESENLAWLDMLVALLERKYRKHSTPVSIEALEDANQFEPRKTKQEQQHSISMVPSSAGRDSSASQTSSSNSKNSASSSRRTSGQHVAGKDQSASVKDEPSRDDQERLDKEKEERRQRILLRHAQQIQDASVSSSTCCGCKTGCLKM